MEPGPAVFSEPPKRIAESVPGNKGGYWAPSVRKVGDTYFLYYSVSTMGAMRSAIGLATNPTLDPASPDYEWTDHGPVVESRDGGNFNAIDPSVFQDDDGSLWLVFGSQWSGIQLIQLDPKTGKRIAPDSPQENLADAEIIEGGFLTKHDGYYYLFLNWGTCCSGVDSTYNIVVGRSKSHRALCGRQGRRHALRRRTSVHPEQERPAHRSRSRRHSRSRRQDMVHLLLRRQHSHGREGHPRPHAAALDRGRLAGGGDEITRSAAPRNAPGR